VAEALEAGDRDGSGYVVCFSGVDVDAAAGRHVADRGTACSRRSAAPSSVRTRTSADRSRYADEIECLYA
jgi:hypothetical protein